SGSTGKPKGIQHTSAGYLTGVYATSKLIFDLKEDDIFWCTADIGWVTGHSYIVYGPLANGATCVIYEGAPDTPDEARFWRLIAPLPGIVATKPGSATRPFPGISAEIVNEAGKPVPTGEKGYLVLTRPWPGMLRTLWGDDERFKQVYWSKYPGIYLTGDGAAR